MPPKRSTSRLEDHAGYWLRFVSNHVSQAFARRVEAEGVTVAEWVVLRGLLDADDAQPSDLAERLGMSRGAISKLVDRVCEKGLVARNRRSDDQRRQSIGLTRAGRKLTPKLARLADENDREFFGHLAAAERARLVDLLRDIVRRNQWKEQPVR